MSPASGAARTGGPKREKVRRLHQPADFVPLPLSVAMDGRAFKGTPGTAALSSLPKNMVCGQICRMVEGDFFAKTGLRTGRHQYRGAAHHGQYHAAALGNGPRSVVRAFHPVPPADSRLFPPLPLRLPDVLE